MKVLCAEDCGNAPKKLLLRDLIIDYWRDGGHMIADNLADQAKWSIVGGPQYEGIQAIGDQMKDLRSDQPSELLIHNIITHGNTAAANVTVTMQDGSRIEYCDVYRFAGFGPKAKIKEITTYSVVVSE